MHILSLDVETSPNLAYVWSLFHNDVITPDKIVEAKRVMCFAGKWLGDDIPTPYAWTGNIPLFFSDFHNGHRVMVNIMHDMLDEADAVVYYNGDRFDRPLCNREMITENMTPPSPYKRVDLYKVVRSEFDFPSGKLDYVVQELGLGRKVEHEGFELWTKCMNGDPEAWDKMKEYNIGDVELNAVVFDHFLPWIPGLPSYGAYTGLNVCPGCGSDSLVKEGFAYTRTGKYQRYSCHVCGTWSRDTRRMSGTQRTQVAVL
jgi:hypothetical protein